MNLEDLVADLSLCKSWKENGGRQDTQLYWICAWNRWTLDLAKNCRTWNGEKIAAPTIGELMEWIKDKVDIEVAYSLEFPESWSVYVYVEPTRLIEDKKLPNALLKMALEVENEP